MEGMCRGKGEEKERVQEGQVQEEGWRRECVEVGVRKRRGYRRVRRKRRGGEGGA